MRNFLIGVALFVSVGVLAFGIVLLEHTVVAWWIPVCAATFIALVSMPITTIVRKSMKLKTDLATYMVHIAVAGIIAFTGIMAINRFLPGTDEHHENGLVVQKYTKERTQSSGRRPRRTRKVKDYYIRIQLPDSTQMEESVSLDRYNRLRSGSQIDLTVRTGFLGWRIVI